MHKIYIRKYKDSKGIELLDIASKWNDLSLGVFCKPEEREDAVNKIKNSLAALEKYGDKIITERNANYNPDTPIRNWFKKLFRKDLHGFGWRAIDVKKIPKNFKKEEARKQLNCIIIEDFKQ